MPGNDKFLESYENQTTEELIALMNEYRIDSIIMVFEAALLAKAEITSHERIVLAVEAIEAGSQQWWLQPVLRQFIKKIYSTHR